MLRTRTWRRRRSASSKLSDHAYAYTAEGDPNTGVVIGDDAVLVIDTQATPAMAADVIRRIRDVTDKPIKYVVLTHYHAVRVLGASAYQPQQILASQDTYDLIVERGEADKASEIGRFPRLFRDVETVPAGLTWPTMTFTGKMTLWLGKLEVQLLQLGRGHTKGDTVVWLPQDRVLLSGDLVEFDATPYAGDAYFQDWPQTLDALAALNARALVPGRGRGVAGRGAGGQGPCGDEALSSPMCSLPSRPVLNSGKDLRKVYKETFAKLQAKVRTVGDLRPLHALRRDPRLRRGHAISRSPHLDCGARLAKCGRRLKVESQENIS